MELFSLVQRLRSTVETALNSTPIPQVAPAPAPTVAVDSFTAPASGGPLSQRSDIELIQAEWTDDATVKAQVNAEVMRRANNGTLTTYGYEHAPLSVDHQALTAAWQQGLLAFGSAQLIEAALWSKRFFQSLPRHEARMALFDRLLQLSPSDQQTAQQLGKLARKLDDDYTRDYRRPQTEFAQRFVDWLPLDSLVKLVRMKGQFGVPDAMPNAAKVRFEKLTPAELESQFNRLDDLDVLAETIGTIVVGPMNRSGVLASTLLGVDHRGAAFTEGPVAQAWKRLVEEGTPTSATQRRVVLEAPLAGARDNLQFPASPALARFVEADVSSALKVALLVEDSGLGQSTIAALQSMVNSTKSRPAVLAAWARLNLDDQPKRSNASEAELAKRLNEGLPSLIDRALSDVMAEALRLQETNPVEALRWLGLQLPDCAERDEMINAILASPTKLTAEVLLAVPARTSADPTRIAPRTQGLMAAMAMDDVQAQLKAWFAGRGELARDFQALSSWGQLDAVSGVIAKGLSSRKTNERRYGSDYLQRNATALLAPLRDDEKIAPYVDRMARIVAAFPIDTQARIFGAFALADAKGSAPVDTAARLRLLLQHAGLVPQKVAQQAAEDPDVPQAIRNALEGLRDLGEDEGLAAAARALGPLFQRLALGAELGDRLGTGSVKQVHGLAEGEALTAAGAFRKRGAAKDIDAAIAALSVDEAVAPLVKRLAPTVRREINLNEEAKAFALMSDHLSPWAASISVPQVRGATQDALIRTLAEGEAVSRILRKRALTAAEKDRIVQTYRALVRAAFDPQYMRNGRGFVLTDPHFGNLMLSADGQRCSLPDPGQYELLDAPAAVALIRLAVHLQGGSLFRPSKADLIQEFTTLLGSALPPEVVAAKLEEAWAAVDKSSSTQPGEFLRAWLNKAAALDLPIPNAYFGAAKMMHSMDSATRDLGLPDVLGQEFSQLYIEQSDLAPVLKQSATSFLNTFVNW